MVEEQKIDEEDEIVEPEPKKMKTDFNSDNSVSLPGIASGTSGPTGFEPGMFKTEDENSSGAKIKTEKDKNVDGQKVMANSILYIFRTTIQT